MTIISIGSLNKVKVDAVKEVIIDNEFFSDPKFICVKVRSDFFIKSKSIEEIVQGAIIRAKNSFTDCEYSFGIENGIAPISYFKSSNPNVSTHFSIGICAIYDNKHFYLGISPGYQVPEDIVKLMSDKRIDIENAANQLRGANEGLIDKEEGFISMLTKGIMNRKEQTKLSIIMAMSAYKNKIIYL